MDGNSIERKKKKGGRNKKGEAATGTSLAENSIQPWHLDPKRDGEKSTGKIGVQEKEKGSTKKNRREIRRTRGENGITTTTKNRPGGGLCALCRNEGLGTQNEVRKNQRIALLIWKTPG